MSDHKEVAVQDLEMEVSVFEEKKAGLLASIPAESLAKFDVMTTNSLPDTSKAKLVSMNTISENFEIEVGEIVDVAVMGFTKELMKSKVPELAAKGVSDWVPVAIVLTRKDDELQRYSIASAMLKNELARYAKNGDILVGSSAVMVRVTRVKDGKSQAGLAYHKYKTQLINVALDDQF